MTDGLVQAIVRTGDTIYIGGRFSRLGPRTGPGVEFALDGSQNAGVPEVSGAGGMVNGSGGAVLAVASDGSGGWYIGGLFTHVGGVPRRNIAHIRADHSVDPAFAPDANDGVHALAMSGSTVYAAGLFTSIGGQTRNRIAGLNAGNGTATAFNPDSDAPVEALAISESGSIIYAGGRFTTIGGQPRSKIAALNATDGTATLTFNPTCDGVVLALARSGPTLYVGGLFKVMGGQLRSNIAALNAGGVLDGIAVPTFNPNANSGGSIPGSGEVSALAVSGSGATVYAGGRFTNIGGQPRNSFAGLDSSDGTATAFDPNPNGSIRGLAISVNDSTIYAAGSFTTIGGESRGNIAALHAADGAATAFNPPRPNAIALAVGVSGSAVYLGGYFSSIGGVNRRGIAAINAADGTATSFDPNVRFGAEGNATVYALAVSGSTLYAGGFFNSVGGQVRSNIAAIDIAAGTPTNWNPGASGTVEKLVVSDSIIYTGGFFTTIGGQTRNYIAALNLSDGSPTAFDPNANSGVPAIVVSGPLVYVGGFFTTIGGQPRNKIAALNPADGSATSWNPDATANANVLALAISGSTIYAGGNFPSIGGQLRKNLAEINTSDGIATSFDPQPNEGVYALAVSGSTLYAAGFFSMIGGETRHLLAGLKPDGSVTDFDPGADPGFGAFALTVAPNGTLYVGGSFLTFDFASQQGFAAFSNPAALLPDVVSRKTHGIDHAFDIDLPIAGGPGIECRSGGESDAHQVVFKFATGVTFSGASVIAAAGNTAELDGLPISSADGEEITLNLTNVSDAQTLSITLQDVSSGGGSPANVVVPMMVLAGDTDEDARVNVIDTNQTKSRSGQQTDQDNFRTDVNLDGRINVGDTNFVKAHSGSFVTASRNQRRR